MKAKKINIKKTLVAKQEPTEEDVLKAMELLTPKDLNVLYFIIIGMIAARGYEFIHE